MNDNSSESTNKQGMHDLLIQDEMRNCYLDYAMSVIVGRALPDVRDGLKPVHRRVLYAMHMLNNYHNRPFMKSARVVGEVIGKYHPHGDSSVYGTIVRLAQDFSMRYPMIDGQGNFGSIDGDSAAAMRYTEVRMEKISAELLDDIDCDTVDWRPNYDGSLKEPAVLPTKIPNLIINGSTGIAVGMATNIPPHNVTEVMDGLLALIDDPDLEVSDIMNYIKGPDFPTAGTIEGVEGIRCAYHTGKGIIQIRARSEIEVDAKTKRERIIITELPYQVNKAKLIEKIASLVNEKEIEGISDIQDESNRLGIRVVIDLKRGESGTIILNRLYKHTQMQVSFGIIFLAINNGRPQVMDLKQMLTSFIEHRREVIIRRTKFMLGKAQEKAHILAGLKTALENLDSVIELIKHSPSPAQAKEDLVKTFQLSEVQSQAILEMRLQRLTGLEKEKIIADYEATMKEIAHYQDILASDELVNQIIKEEFIAVKAEYSDKRRTEIVALNDEILLEDLIKEEDVIVTITKNGYIKRMAIDTYRAQKRGGVGVKGADLEDDFYTNIFTANTHTTLMFFTDKGNVFSLKVYSIPEGNRTAKGRNIVNLLPISKDENVKDIIPMPADIQNKYLIMVTERGLIKKTDLTEYENIKVSGKRAIKLVEDDSIVNVRVISEKQDVFICSSAAKTIRFPVDDLRTQGRVSQGVRGIDLDVEEKVIGMEVVQDNMQILSVTELGYGKRTMVEEYRSQMRGGKGIFTMKITPKIGNIIKIRTVQESDHLMVITTSGQVIRMLIKDISLLGRTTQGVRLIRLKEGERVVAIENMVETEDECESESESELE